MIILITERTKFTLGENNMSQSNFSVKVKGDRYKRTGTGIENTQSLH